ncbi:MAG: hypothetical protein JJT95_16025 [Pararhodobacter sp.]|nr:hypothetical protein [Pararhodobacter sp.]
MLALHAAWVLLVAFGLSFVYETWRLLARREVSVHDTPAEWRKGLVIYAIAAAVILALFAGLPGSAWAGLALSLAFVLISTFYYNPVVMRDRSPGVVDWVEDILFTGLIFVAAWILALHLLGFELSRAG